ncbi:hypothetical protein GCM10011320_38220 [Neoroseomonas lacus]|uniref:Uncharacterized protein n=1 Tax=Neoroseomonas lacus TaxID=287609 RepID=A0A917NT55_9PROT|nr:hypothetical protein GCM10011320_38220 [Neoroseomonas lacus]
MEDDGVAVGRRLKRRLGSDDAAAAATVFDDDGLAEILRHSLRRKAPDDIGRTARCEGDHHADGSVRIGGLLRARGQRRDQQGK